MPSVPYKYRPGVGFVLFVLIAVSSVWFFRFGLARPDLDRAWELLITLEGKPDAGLTEGDARLIWGLMQEHQPLVHELLQDRLFGLPGGLEDALSPGWTVLMLAPGEDRSLLFSCPQEAQITISGQDPGSWPAGKARLFPGSADQYAAYLLNIRGADSRCSLRMADQ